MHFGGHGTGRHKFQDFISQFPGAPAFTRGEWLDAEKVTYSKKLAELIKLAMTSTWSDWTDGSQGLVDCTFTPIIQAEAGGYLYFLTHPSLPPPDRDKQGHCNCNNKSHMCSAQCAKTCLAATFVSDHIHVVAAGVFITQWLVGLAGDPTKDQDTFKVVLLQGQAAGNCLTAAQDGMVNSEHRVYEAPPGAGFSSVHGSSGLWLTGFMGSPGPSARRWVFSAEHLGVPGGKVVGYQMRTGDGLRAARFLFRPFNEQGEFLE